MATRRSILKAGAGGLCLLTAPQFLAACAKSPHSLASGSPNPFLARFSVDEGVIQQVLAALTSRGADAAELFFQHTRTNTIFLEDGAISKASTQIEQGVGLRVVVGDKVGYALTEEITLEAMLKAANTAAAIADAGGSPEIPETFVHQELGGLYAIEVPFSEVGIDQKIPVLQKLEGMCRAGDPAVDKVSIHYTDTEDHVMLADLSGKIAVDTRPMTKLYASVTASKGGETQTGGASLAARDGFDFLSDANLQTTADEAVGRTMVRFEAIRAPSGEMPVVLEAGASGILLHEAIGHGMEADFNRKNLSIYSDLLNKKVAADFITIVDDGTLPNERGALNIDDEGNPTERTVLVENGILKSYLHDGMSARHYGVAPTGSGRRESFRHPIQPRMRCTTMENGPHTRDEIIQSVKHGIIAETYTNGVVHIGAGDYTFYVKNGWLIEDGKVTAPVRDCNIIGNGPDTLEKITMVANNSRLDTGGWTCGKSGQRVPVSQGMPTCLVSALTVGGTDA